jgi:hypothetical protein
MRARSGLQLAFDAQPIRLTSPLSCGRPSSPFPFECPNGLRNRQSRCNNGVSSTARSMASSSYPALTPPPAGRRTSTSATRQDLVDTLSESGHFVPANNRLDNATRKREPFSTVPFAPDPDFVDRPEILAWIRDKCAKPGARAALVGLGGVG